MSLDLREKAFDALRAQRLSVRHNSKWLTALLEEVRAEAASEGMDEERKWWLARLAALKASGYESEVSVIAAAIDKALDMDPERRPREMP